MSERDLDAAALDTSSNSHGGFNFLRLSFLNNPRTSGLVRDFVLPAATFSIVAAAAVGWFTQSGDGSAERQANILPTSTPNSLITDSERPDTIIRHSELPDLDSVEELDESELVNQHRVTKASIGQE